ncbi:hypothetical protein T4D_4215 [Trichinella pseudospiralis]|uniref:Uncharacterized protein n=1 Tax=Trichinella pseudospiralis TaxID=6337 RepID=A0A0V1FV39_TRIPS|nr:hypothetical protein T4D_4215 [Trichinella pseudospiralis]
MVIGATFHKISAFCQRKNSECMPSDSRVIRMKYQFRSIMVKFLVFGQRIADWSNKDLLFIRVFHSIVLNWFENLEKS